MGYLGLEEAKKNTPGKPIVEGARFVARDEDEAGGVTGGGGGGETSGLTQRAYGGGGLSPPPERPSGPVPFVVHFSIKMGWDKKLRQLEKRTLWGGNPGEKPREKKKRVVFFGRTHLWGTLNLKMETCVLLKMLGENSKKTKKKQGLPKPTWIFNVNGVGDQGPTPEVVFGEGIGFVWGGCPGR
ncbi:unnamed protein product [Danaus chrysippus]|uniref:(African queen) hypothetical protein n=1 Tax=Danaus chrysippus TaxID=151541 RepID=A0A8J2QTX6_9NEOP|nr:unnamed protein product [Danaus chrysippus]